jgi:hypothetical protein
MRKHSSVPLLCNPTLVNLAESYPIGSGPRRGKWKPFLFCHKKKIDMLLMSPVELQTLLLQRLQGMFFNFRVGKQDHRGKFARLEASVGVASSYVLGDEHFGAYFSRAARKSNVIVNSIERDQTMSRLNAGLFPANKTVLHPARVRGFLSVSIQLDEVDASGQQVNQHPVIRDVHFALVDYFQSHPLRHQWTFRNVYEIWSPHIESDISQSSLVCVDHLLGRFVPGVFDQYDPDYAKTKNLAYNSKRLQHCLSESKRDPPAMVVLSHSFRDPFR